MTMRSSQTRRASCWRLVGWLVRPGRQTSCDSTVVGSRIDSDRAGVAGGFDGISQGVKEAFRRGRKRKSGLTDGE